MHRLNPNLPSKALLKNSNAIGVSSSTEVECITPQNKRIIGFLSDLPLNSIDDVSTNYVILAIASTDSSATGMDSVSLIFFKIIIPYITYLFTDLLNIMLFVSSTWKMENG